MRIHAAAVSAAALLVWAAAGLIAAPAHAAAQCAQATVSHPDGTPLTEPDGTPEVIQAGQTPASAPGGECWTDVLPYPFGTDGLPVTVLTATTTSTSTLPVSTLSLHSLPAQEQGGTGAVSVVDNTGIVQPLHFTGTGATLSQCGGVSPPCLTDVSGGTVGAQIPAGALVTFLSGSNGSVPATSSDYETVTSMAFRAWNRGLAATTPDGNPTEPNPPNTGGSNAFGVWKYNGTRWAPVPYPGSSACPGDTILWAGKLDYWLIGGGSSVLCRFDGVDNVWEPMTAPAAAFPPAANFAQSPGITDINAGSCFAWNNCWFFGTGGAVVHWDGASLTPESVGIAATPWLGLDYEGATAATGPSGAPIAAAVGGLASPDQRQPALSKPEADPELFTSDGGPFAPVGLDSSAPAFGDGPTDLVSVSFDSNGDGWVAGNSTPSQNPPAQYAPVFPISPNGSSEQCPTTQEFPSAGSQLSYRWGGSGANGPAAPVATGGGAVAAVPDGSAVVGGQETPAGQSPSTAALPALVQISCSAATVTTFQTPAPGTAGGQLIPADVGSTIGAVAASATDDAWAATTNSTSNGPAPAGLQYFGPPHLYQWTDGNSQPNAPAGNDIESRPVVTTQSPTVFDFPPPVVVTPAAVTPPTTVTRAKPKKKHRTLPPATYDVHKPKLHALRKKGSYRLTVTFKVRRKVTIGLDALHRGKVVARSGMKTFSGKTGALSVVVHRGRWPTGLKFVQPGKKS